eukprot:snap_masked-scaffold_31-processed-gene-1.46-mRNA-1 protein AED:1.00 eAED:1.00 QI:0/-1/0/0/-1/1/1/0/277
MPKHEKALTFHQDFSTSCKNAENVLESQEKKIRNTDFLLNSSELTYFQSWSENFKKVELEVLHSDLENSLSFLPKYDIQQYTKTLNSLDLKYNKLLFLFHRLSKPRSKLKLNFKNLNATKQNNKEKEIELLTATTKEKIYQNQTGVSIEISNIEFSNYQIVLKNLIRCNITSKVELTDLSCENLIDCSVSMGVIKNSCFVMRCKDTNFTLSSKQLRIHETKICSFILFTISGPIIEDSTKLKFSERKDLESTENNKWNDVKDFSWLNKEKNPNYELM